MKRGWIAAVVACIVIATVIIPSVFTKPNAPSTSSIRASINTKCITCGGLPITKAEIRRASDHALINTVTSKVSSVDGNTVSFNKGYILRVYVPEVLQIGDKIIVYAKYGCTPVTTTTRLEDTEWNRVGSGNVLTSYACYQLIITEDIAGQQIFDISIDPSNPTTVSIRVDMVRYINCPQPEEKRWHDESGNIIINYSVNVNYIVTASDNIDTGSIYLDLSFMQTIINKNTATIIMTGMIQQMTVHVPTINDAYVVETNDIPLIPRPIAGTDNVTINIDVTAIVRGVITGTDDWIETDRMFASIRDFDISWY